MGFRYPDEPTTPEQWQIIAWMFIVSLLGLGVTAWYFATQTDKSDIAWHLAGIGVASFLMATAVWGLKRGVEIFVG
jgi:phosphoglycerol transferase MdoB-like AlkP superfamily enzyme